LGEELSAIESRENVAAGQDWRGLAWAHGGSPEEIFGLVELYGKAGGVGNA
jgi:hypothetical protein